MGHYDEIDIDVDDVSVLNRLKFKAEKFIPRFRDKVDSKRYKTSNHVDVVKGMEIQIKLIKEAL